MLTPNELRKLSGICPDISGIEESAYSVLAELLDALRAGEDSTTAFLSLHLSEDDTEAIGAFLRDAGHNVKTNPKTRTITIYGY